MIAFKKGNYLDEAEMNKGEAKEFIQFLQSELDRHEEHLRQYKKIAGSDTATDFMRVVAQTVVVRNLDDIAHTKRTIEYLTHKFSL